MDESLMRPKLMKGAAYAYVLFRQPDGQPAIQKVHRITKRFVEYPISNREFGTIPTRDLMSFHGSFEKAETARDYARQVAEMLQQELGMSVEDAREHFKTEDSWEGIGRGLTAEQYVAEFLAEIAA